MRTREILSGGPWLEWLESDDAGSCAPVDPTNRSVGVEMAALTHQLGLFVAVWYEMGEYHVICQSVRRRVKPGQKSVCLSYRGTRLLNILLTAEAEWHDLQDDALLARYSKNRVERWVP